MTSEPTPGRDIPTPPADSARDPGPGGSGRPRNPSPVRLAAIEALQAVAANLPGRPDEVLTAIESAAHDPLRTQEPERVLGRRDHAHGLHRALARRRPPARHAPRPARRRPPGPPAGPARRTPAAPAGTRRRHPHLTTPTAGRPRHPRARSLP